MNMANNKEHSEFKALIVKAQEGVLSQEESVQFNHLMELPENQKTYFEMVRVACALNQMQLEDMPYLSHTETDSILNMKTWEQFVEYEKTAPVIDIPEEKPQRELIQKVVGPSREKRKISKFQIATFILSAAAILLVILFVRIVPTKPYSMDVATLVDQMDVQWGQSGLALDTGSRMWTNQGQLNLKKGIVKFLYDDGVSIIIEGPALFEIEQARILLEYGRIYSRISKTGLGFTVKTPTSLFVDMGTEFGVQADVNGSSELHVIKGQVQLFAGSGKAGKSGKMVTQDHAVRYDAYNDQIKDAPVKNNAFIRAIDSKNRVVWRGQRTIDLADVVGGGNGLGSGVFGAGIISANGEFVEVFDSSGYHIGSNSYKPVVSNPFIDGVFVPDGGEKPVQISSQNHYFKECPDTNATFWVGIKSRGQHEVKGDIKQHALTLQGVPYDSPEWPAIYIHPNQGITFDLQQIREFYPSFDITRFTAIFGLSDSMANPNVFEGGAVLNPLTKVGSYWVLIDGELRSSKSGLNPTDAPISIDIAITEKDRFLTLVATADIIDHVWSLFAKPMLHMHQSE